MKDTEQRFLEVIQWYDYHQKNSQSADLRQQVKLLKDMNSNLFTLMTMFYRDFRMAQANSRKAGPSIVMPASMAPVVPFRRKFDG